MQVAAARTLLTACFVAKRGDGTAKAAGRDDAGGRSGGNGDRGGRRARGLGDWWGSSGWFAGGGRSRDRLAAGRSRCLGRRSGAASWSSVPVLLWVTQAFAGRDTLPAVGLDEAVVVAR